MMSTFRRLLTISASSAVALVLVTGTANASFIQTATGPTIASFTAPAITTNPPSAAPGSASVAQFSLANANAAIAGECPAGFTCTPNSAVLVGIEVDVTAGLTATLNLTGGPGTIAGTVGGNQSTSTSGIAANAGLTLTAFDPLSTETLAFSPTLISVATNGINLGGNFYSLGSGTATFSGAATGTSTLFTIYCDNVTDCGSVSGNWATAATDYSGAGNVTMSLYLNGFATLGTTTFNILNSSTASGALTGGNVTVDYLYDITETSITPEPTTLFLMGSALVGVGLLRKRMKS